MRYPKDHKEKTRQLIVEKAAELFKKEGYNGCGIDAVMKAAGLTPGGFYAHFADKGQLLAEVLKTSKAPSVTDFFQRTPQTGAAVDAMLDWYLSMDHQGDPAHGCPIPALAGEIARQPAAVRRAFTVNYEANLKEIAARCPERTRREREDRAMITMASMVGAMLFARALNDDRLSKRLLKTMREQLQIVPDRMTRGANIHVGRTLTTKNVSRKAAKVRDAEFSR